VTRPGPPEVVCIGIATLDAIALVDRLPTSGERLPAVEVRLAGGGVAATAAVTLAHLGVSTAFIGRVGEDEAGRWIRAGLADAGVDVSGLRAVAGRSPASVVLVDAEAGERSLIPDVRGVPPLGLRTEDMGLCASAAWVHVDQTGYPVLGELAASGVETPVSLDGGNFVDELHLDRIALYAPTERALLARYPGLGLDEALDAALAEGPRIVAATRGSAGSVAAERGADGAIRHYEVPAIETPVMSTLGAGDVFHGALIAALLEGRPLPDALRFANVAAGLSCRSLDGRSGIPSRREVDESVALLPRAAGHA
jgi:sugar/nucleoside kinase (ribokinase family)